MFKQYLLIRQKYNLIKGFSVKKILQQYFDIHINNGGPATCALLLMDSFLKNKYKFIPMMETHLSGEGVFKQFKYFYTSIKQEKPDLVHIRGVQLHGFWAVLAAKLAGVKCVLSVDGLSIDSAHVGRIKMFLYRYILEPYALSHADLTYCVCKAMADREFIRKHTKNLYGYIHNAAPKYDLSNRTEERAVKRLALDVQDDIVVITNIGRITKEKGIHNLAECFSKIVLTFDNVVLCIAGDGDYIEELKQNYSTLIDSGKIKLLGKIKDVKELLLASDIFVFPTLHENLSNSLLEASYVGLPVIASNVGGNPEVIEDSKTGLLVPPDNVEALSEAMRQLIEDPLQRIILGRNAAAKIEKEFSQEVIFKQMDEMYSSIFEVQ